MMRPGADTALIENFSPAAISPCLSFNLKVDENNAACISDAVFNMML